MQRKKISLSKRLKLALVSIVLVSVLTGTIVALQFIPAEKPSTQNGMFVQEEDAQDSQNHFSVVYRGFRPGSALAAFPDYYICINDLAGDTLTSKIRLEIKNQEGSDYYFKLTNASYLPPEWDVTTYFGLVRVDQTREFSGDLRRDMPSSIPAGMDDETLDLALQAYFDEFYTEFYSEDTFDVTFYFIDREAPSWTIFDYNNFDNYTSEGWTNCAPTYLYYRSYPCSVQTNIWFRKTIVVPEIYIEAYLIFSARPWGSNFQIYFNGTAYFLPEGSSTTNWVQVAVPLWIGATEVWIYTGTAYAYMDDVYIIAR